MNTWCKRYHGLQASGYRQFEYANAELADLFAATDLVISRAGANSLYEILALGKPHILIPLPLKSSRGDQIKSRMQVIMVYGGG